MSFTFEKKRCDCYGGKGCDFKDCSESAGPIKPHYIRPDRLVYGPQSRVWMTKEELKESYEKAQSDIREL